MANKMIKAEAVIETSLALLEREAVLGATVWRDAFGDFAGKKNDTVTIRLPAYAGRARTNALRSGASRTRDSLHERSVDVKLDTRVYKDVEVTDEEFTL